MNRQHLPGSGEGFQSTIIMDEFKRKYEEFLSLAGHDDAKSCERKEELLKWFEENRTADTEALATELASKEADAIEEELRSIRSQINEGYNLLPVSYIAHRYFGKSASWLSQRINGTRVRGKVYTLNNEQKARFNSAVQEVARTIGSISIS